MSGIPKIKEVTPIKPFRLKVKFDNDVVKEYDCTPLLEQPAFSLLNNPAFFMLVHVDTGGYGISWNEDIDLSEYELWANGKEIM